MFKWCDISIQCFAERYIFIFYRRIKEVISYETRILKSDWLIIRVYITPLPSSPGDTIWPKL